MSCNLYVLEIYREKKKKKNITKYIKVQQEEKKQQCYRTI